MKLTVYFHDGTIKEYANIDYFNYSSLDNGSLTFYIRGRQYELYFIDVYTFEIS